LARNEKIQNRPGRSLVSGPAKAPKTAEARRSQVAEPHELMNKCLGLPLVIVVDLATDLALREIRVVNIGVGYAREYSANELIELACCDSLACGANDVARVDRSRYNCLANCSCRTVWPSAAAAKKYRYTARSEAVAEMDVCHSGSCGQADIGEFERDRLRVIVDDRAKRPGCG
jgi:hypothetical protein